MTASTAKPEMGTGVARPMPRPTAQVEPYVKALGPELAVIFLLHYGGAELFIRTRACDGAEYADLVGGDGARALAEHADKMQRRVPLAKAWLTAMLDWQGYSVTEIARKLRVSDTSVRNMLKARKR